MSRIILIFVTIALTRAALADETKDFVLKAEPASESLLIQLDAKHVSEAAQIKAFILPMFEGSYVPTDDAQWAEFLSKHGPLNTTEMAMPFLGLDFGDHTVTYIFTHPFNNELKFEAQNGRLSAELIHHFPANQKKRTFSVKVCVGGASPTEPAKIYRKYLIDRGEFLSLKDKIARTPDAEKLLGAAHIYLWGDDHFSKHDAKDFKAFAKKLSRDKFFGGRLRDEGKKIVQQATTMPTIDNYTKRVVAAEVSEMISSLQPKDVVEFSETFKDAIEPWNNWGDGVSPKFVQMLHDGGIDRAWLGVSNWKGLWLHSSVVAKAKEHGYLIGPYDSYESIHAPGEADTWETAQFDRALYETGPVVLANGEKKHGFKKKGFALNSIAARPAVEKRVRTLMESWQTNSWFIDCDAFGQLHDDYSPAHPMTQADDMRERLSRMAWIRDTFKCVIGSEGGSAYAASTIHFAHGMTTPVIGWGDEQMMKDKSSKYFVGAWYPADGPAIFFKQVPLKDEYRHVYVDPKFRLPLYETVFHDSVVATHHWSAGSLKFVDEDHARELTELLYGVPPLYHMNIDEWQKRQAEIKSHYEFFSPLHRRIATLAMTEFAWLSDDRMVQRTKFGDEVEMIANFGEASFRKDDFTVPGRTLLERDVKTRASKLYKP